MKRKEKFDLVSQHLILQHSTIEIAHLLLVALCRESVFSVFKYARRAVKSSIHSMNKDFIDPSGLWIGHFL